MAKINILFLITLLNYYFCLNMEILIWYGFDIEQLG